MSFINPSMREALSSLSDYPGVIKTQISIYNRLKKHYPGMPENELLNKVVISRMRALPRVGSKEQEQAYYAQFLESPNKTLEDVIWAIINYEFILSRAQEAIIKGQQMGLTMDEIARVWHDFETSVKHGIREALEQNTTKAQPMRWQDRLEIWLKRWFWLAITIVPVSYFIWFYSKSKVTLFLWLIIPIVAVGLLFTWFSRRS